MAEDHPAMIASRASWRCVQSKAKEEWLALFADSDDICIEDPIGVSPIDPAGQGLRGRDAIKRFWDTNVAPNAIEINMRHSYTAGNEAAHLGTLTTTFSSGAQVSVEGIFTYKVDETGKLVSLRGFWELDKAVVTRPGASSSGG